MSWFQLDPNSIAERAQRGNSVAAIPSTATSIRRGIIGFTLVSVAGFSPWALGGRWFHQRVGEAGLYAACALVFIGLSGLLMHRLIIGPGSMGRWYKLFGIAFTAYAIAWIAAWMTLRGNAGSLVGLFAGTAVMALILTRSFDAKSVLLKVIISLFVFNVLGYFAGGWVERNVIGWKVLSQPGLGLERAARMRLAMLMWGVCYGIGFGAGLGLAFHFCQTEARALLSRSREQLPHSTP